MFLQNATFSQNVLTNKGSKTKIEALSNETKLIANIKKTWTH